jgi:subtilase family serine protease
MAPKAKIYLVEAASPSYANLLSAVLVANNLVASAGGGEVSMSWGGSEFSSERRYDSYFTQPGVVYFASSGDSPGVIWPSSSPNVVSVGGTSVSRNPTTGAFQQEMAWQSGGGGASRYELRPSYQNASRPSCRPAGHRTLPPSPTPTPAFDYNASNGTSSAARALLKSGPASSRRRQLLRHPERTRHV